MIDAEDLNHPLRIDDCQACGAIDWRDCVCTPGGRREPTARELERGRRERLTQAETQKASANE